MGAEVVIRIGATPQRGRRHGVVWWQVDVDVDPGAWFAQTTGCSATRWRVELMSRKPGGPCSWRAEKV